LRWDQSKSIGCLDGLNVAIKDESFIAGKKHPCKSFIAERINPPTERWKSKCKASWKGPEK